MRIERKGGRERGKKALFFISETVVLFQSEKKKKREKVEREARGEEIFLLPHYSPLTVNSQLWPA